MTPPLHPAAFAALLRRITRPGRYCPRVTITDCIKRLVTREALGVVQ
jgi:hypothetical protein